MTFEREGITFNLLDTPGHEDFSEDTYRTLTAVDSAIMVIDAAKGIEPQTRKLFEVCRLRSVPIITFINKVDREGRSPFDLMDEVADALALDVCPMSWPVGMGGVFQGVLDFATGLTARPEGDSREFLGKREQAELPSDIADEVELAQGGYPSFDIEAYRHGDLTPVYFGSALKNFGVAELIDAIARFAPPPRPQPSSSGEISPERPEVTGFIFKVQANMDPQHRDRIAFMRLVSGTFKRGMKLVPSGLGKPIAVHSPILFFAQDREIADTAEAGDIIGIPNHGTLRVGDTLSEKNDVRFTGLPNFAPEILRRVALKDPTKTKQLRKALDDLSRRRRDPGVLSGDRRAVDRRRGRPVAARSADLAAGGGIQGRGRAGALAIRYRALAQGQRCGAEALHRFQQVEPGQGPRRRSGVHGALKLGCELSAGEEPGAGVQRDQGAVTQRPLALPARPVAPSLRMGLEFLAVVDMREGLVGHRHAKMGAERLPALRCLEDQQAFRRDAALPLRRCAARKRR